MLRALFILSFICLSIPSFSQSSYNQNIELYRKNKKEEFKKNERSPLKTDEELEKLDYYPIDEKYSLNCKFESAENAKPFDLPTYSGATRLYVLYGTATCIIDEQEIKLNIYKNLTLTNPIYKNYLFLPIKDLTSGEETYDGGRYLDLKTSDIVNGAINIDFNKSYNPWCAYSDGYSCPIPPRENHLKIAIKAGEKNYKGKYK